MVAKKPVPGKVKTRLSPEISPEEAAVIYQCMLEDKIKEFSTLTGIDLAIAFTPTNAKDAFVSFSRLGFALFAQKGKDLGERLSNIFVDKFTAGYQAVIVIGSDSPDLPKSTVQEAFHLLLSESSDVVFGPCYDGGYYLIGMRKPYPELFKNIPWSTANVLEATLERARKIGIKAELLSWWNDLDTFEDLIGFYNKYRGQKKNDCLRGEKTLSFLSHLKKIHCK